MSKKRRGYISRVANSAGGLFGTLEAANNVIQQRIDYSIGYIKEAIDNDLISEDEVLNQLNVKDKNL
jgi:hypothetical protein